MGPFASARLSDGTHARRAPSRSAGASPVVIPRRGLDTAPLSFAQQQVWLHSQLAPNVPLYNEQVTIRYRGSLDPALLARAFSHLLARHEAWRTVFVTEAGALRQRILSPDAMDLPLVDLRHLAPDEREREAVRLATEDLLRPFDLARGPLVRVRLAWIADDDSRLYLTLHHAIFDGYSLYQVAVPELAALYAAEVAGTRASLPELPIQYADWAAWQRAEVDHGTYGAQLDYWLKQLADASAVDLPSDRPRSAAPSHRGGMHAFALPGAVAAGLRTLARSERVTMYMALVAAYLVLLHRYTGRDDLILGTVSGGRKRPEVARLLGFFCNPLALRVDCSGNPTFVELLRRVRDVALDALANDDLPFEHVVAALQPARDAGRHPFFQTVMSLEAPLARLPEGWDLWHLDVHPGTSKFDLYLEMNDRPDGLVGCLVYATDLFGRDTIARMAGHYANLLAAAVEDPTRSLSALPMLNAAERHRLLVDWAQAPEAYPDPATVHGVFEAQAARTPDATALIFDDARLTYRELDARASAIARRLRALDVGCDAVVAVLTQRTPTQVAALLGVLKAGGAYLPLDPTHPAQRLTMMIQDAGARVMLTDRVAFPSLPGVQIVALDTIEPGEPEAGVDVGLDALAYVMYTSGSTGRPKGVAVPHRGILRLVFGQTYAHFGPDETFVQMAPPAFDAATFELWGALLHGARCVLFPGAVPTHATLRDTISRHRVTTVWLTASLFNTVIDEAPDALAGVRTLITGGEALSPRHVARAATLLPDTRLVNGYGPTEATTFTTCHIIRPHDLDATSIPIGRPIAGTDVYLLDRDGQPVPVGVPGELYIGGAGLARGYVNLPDVTAERFVPHPFDRRSDARLYRSGDLARWRPDGTLEYLGRLDAQVKIRGVRVEPAEVEAVLGAHPSVREVAVIATDGDRPNDVRLVAYVVPGHAEAPTSADLRNFVKRRLPSAFVPSAFVLLETLPVGPTGKLDRRAPPAAAPAARAAREIVRAHGPLKRQLAEVWRELLGVPEVGTTDDFFDLGGHSLLAVRMLQRVHDLYGTSLPLAVLYTNPTIDGLAEALIASEPAEFQAPLVRLREGGARPPLFFFHGDINGGGFYTLTLARRLATDRALWVVHPLGLHDRPAPTTIEAMARVHVEQLIAACPDGPLVLGGYCNGGLVAYETARLLTAAGRRVERLVLIATDADTRFRTLRRPIAAAARGLGLGPEGALEQFGRVRYFADRLRELDTPGQAALLARGAARLARQAAQRLRHALMHVRARGTSAAAAVAPAPPPRLFERYYDACMGYVPGPWPGHVVVFWPEGERPARPGDPSYGWQSLVSRVETFRIPGDHDEIVTRHIERIAATLEELLA